jgi:type IV pilus assembly protein PilM
VFPLRPRHEESKHEGEDVPPEFDPGVVGRLSAYAPDGSTDEGAPAFEGDDSAVESGLSAELADEAEDEPDGPAEEKSPPGPYELELDEPDEEEAAEFALPEADLAEPGLFAAELAMFDLEDTFDEELEPRSRSDGEDHAVEEAAVAEVLVDAQDDALAELEPDEDEIPVAQAETEPDDVVAAEAALVEAALLAEDDADEPESSGRRSFRRRRAASREKEPKQKKTRGEKTEPKEKRASKDRKSKRLVGLKIGSSQIAAAQVVNNGAPELVEVFREPLEAGLVVSGEIRDPEALGVALKRLFELHKLPKRGVRLGLANNRIGVRIFEIEGVTDSQQLDNAIRFRAEEVLPIPLDQAVLDYVVLDEATRDDGTPWKRILLVVAYREVVDRYLLACRNAGLEVVGIDLEAFALLRAVEAPMDRDEEAGALVAVAIGHDRTTIAVSTGRHCEFTRVLDWGGWSLNVAIARELDRAPSEVEGLKRQLSFAGPTEAEGFTPEQSAKAREAIQRSLSAFVRELVASLQFYQAQPGALGIGEVVLTGGTAHMDGLPDAIGEQLGVPIRLGDPFKRMKVGPKVAHEGPRGSLSVAIGLGIED